MKSCQPIERNILIDTLPLTVPVGGRNLRIETNFRTGILFEMMFQNGHLSDEEKAVCAINLFFPKDFPTDQDQQQQAVEGMLWFYSCGNPPKDNKQPAEKKKSAGMQKRIYDYDVDAPLIYAAFLSQYRIDLQDIPYLHWWKFIALFQGLSEQQKIVEIMGYRSINLAKIKNRAERERYAALQAKYSLPDNMTTEEKVAAVGALFGGILQ